MISTLMSSPDIQRALPPFAPAEVVLPAILTTVGASPEGMAWLLGGLKRLDETGDITGVPYGFFGL